jgi:hypothetical protein
VNSKIRVRNGAFEVEFEGSEDFIKNNLQDFIECLPMPKGVVVTPTATVAGIQGTANGAAYEGDQTTTTSTIAQKLGGGSGPELALAAVARLVVVLAQPSAARDEILNEMKNATTFYKSSYSGNLSKILGRLVKNGDVNDIGGNRYNLSQTKRASVVAALAQQ